MHTLLCLHCGNLVVPQFGLYPFPSSRVTHYISAAIKLISSSNLSHPPFIMIYIPLSPSSNFLHSWSHLSSVQDTETGCLLKFVTQVLSETQSNGVIEKRRILSREQFQPCQKLLHTVVCSLLGTDYI